MRARGKTYEKIGNLLIMYMHMGGLNTLKLQAPAIMISTNSHTGLSRISIVVVQVCTYTWTAILVATIMNTCFMVLSSGTW